jgi:hypothetical protein
MTVPVRDTAVRGASQVGLGKDTKATFTLGFTKSNELFVGRLASAQFLPKATRLSDNPLEKCPRQCADLAFAPAFGTCTLPHAGLEPDLVLACPVAICLCRSWPSLVFALRGCTHEGFQRSLILTEHICTLMQC